MPVDYSALSALQINNLLNSIPFCNQFAMASSTTRYLRGRKRVLHKDDIPLDSNIFNENNNNSGGLGSNTPIEQQPPLVSQSEKQNYNKSILWDLGNLSPSILFAEAAVVTLIVGTLVCIVTIDWVLLCIDVVYVFIAQCFAHILCTNIQPSHNTYNTM